ncbi:MAG: hypothetical protein LBP59_06690 [Planctomycetaceae bacterium]|nr:hypothetical protein [Planctomycetaceae bacterium]
MTWNKIIVKKTKNAPSSNEYKEGAWSIIARKIKIEHRYSSNTNYQAKSTPTENNPVTFTHQPVIVDTDIHLTQIQFSPEKAGYTKETYRIFIVVPKLLKSNNQHAKDSNGNDLYWSSYSDITITYNVPEFKLVAVKFTSDHGKLRPNAYNTAPNCYDIGNMPTYKTQYPDGTRQWTWTRNSTTGILTETNQIHQPITHSWKHADPNAKIEYTIKVKNFGATIKGKIYLGNSKPNDPNLFWIPPSEGNTKDYNIDSLNNNGTIEYNTLNYQLPIRHETTNNLIVTLSFGQYVYWTFDTPQVDINEARIKLAVNNVFVNLTSSDILNAIKNKLFVNPYLGFGSKNIASSHPENTEIYFWNRANEGLVDCISHSEFYKRVCKAIGMPADFGAQTLIADYATINSPNLPKEAKIGNFGGVTKLFILLAVFFIIEVYQL